MGMPYKVDRPDAVVARIAARQHGVVTAKQLAAAGIGRAAISERAKRGRLHRLHRGVYAVGHRAPSRHRRWMAAVLACGDGAVLSHHSAAALWGLLKPIQGPVHVSVPTTSGLKKRHGIHIHRCLSLRPADPSPSTAARDGTPLSRTTRRHYIPTTTVQRTIDDLEGTVAPYLLRRAKRQAELKGIRLKGVEPKRLRSDLEEAFLTLFLAHGFPHPETNVKIGRWEVDFLWRSRRLVVEADFFAYHQGSISFDDDHSRDLDLRSRGHTVLRFTDRQLEDEPDRIVADVAQALNRSAAPR
ncbi:MAG TPA: type IV toxin-antitoxin system AbiEi family antitoxin domain-containing protein [Solirubrobacterales bacterium]|nr:type IV toxin-antitoxin system AbiEi family antitoxin domain-containing protein [Solirubrobacterales bacterium]